MKNNNYCDYHQTLDYSSGGGWQHSCCYCPSNWATYCLFAGRHELPENSGELFTSFNFNTMRGVRSENFEAAFEEGSFNLYVTGLTSATVEVVNEAYSRGVTIRLLHYNRDTGGYNTQWVCPQ